MMLLLVWCLLLLASSLCDRVIRIHQLDGNDTETCLSYSTGKIACRTLEYVFAGIRGKSDVTIYIDTNITLKGIMVLENMTDISISGSDQVVTNHRIKTVACSENTVLLFTNITNINLLNLELNGCGAYKEAAIVFNISSRILLVNTTIRKAHCTGIAFLNCKETVVMERVHVYRNGCAKNCNNPTGVTIKMTEWRSVVNYTLTACIFKSDEDAGTNIASTMKQYGDGGGLGIHIAKNCSGNRVSLNETHFYGNRARFGGGMYVRFRGFSSDNSILVENCQFDGNSAEEAGGGASVLFTNDKSVPALTNSIIFRNVSFNRNSAGYGGGVALAAKYSDRMYKPGENIFFHACNWTENKAAYSPAIDISPFFERFSDKSGFLPIPVFSLVTVSNNIIEHPKLYKLKATSHINSGVFSITLFTVYFTEMVVFTNNRYSALHLTSAIVVFEKHTLSIFQNNLGGNGAAIAMYSFSTLLVTENTRFEFTENDAAEYGGGIYYETTDQHDFLSSSSCFIQHKDPGEPEHVNITFIFQKNKAGSGGSSIYANSFQSCSQYCNSTYYLGHFDNRVLDCIGNFSFENTSLEESSLESSGSNFTFYDDIEEYEVIPGSKGMVPFSVSDEFNHPVEPLMHLGLSVPHHCEASIHVSPPYFIKNDTGFTPIGEPGSTTTINLIAYGINGVFFRFNITLLDCPPGFYFNNDSMSCACSTDRDLYSAINQCNYSCFRASMSRDYWAGYIPSYSTKPEDLFFAPCFNPVCQSNYNKLIALPNTTASEDLNSAVCSANRTGIMCGFCRTNHSVYYHSSEYLCSENQLCKLGPLFYVLSEVLPVVALFSIIVIFDLSFTSGGMVGFIFFCQYLDKLTLHVNSLFSALRKPYRFFYGIFNFEYFMLNALSFCLWEDFQILDIIFFKYVTILIAFTLVIGLVLLLQSNRCSNVLKWRSKVTTKASFLKGLSAFLVICYSQCTKTSFLILKYTRPRGMHGRLVGTYSYYGGLPYFQGKHLIYAIPAVISVVFVTILPPLVLLLYPLTLQLLSTCGLSEHWMVNKTLQLTGINKLKPFIDCFQSCYKDKLRCFAGLYFVYRVAILMSFTVFETYYSYRMSSEIMLVVFLGLHSLLQPYKEHAHNLIDTLVFLNLALINLLSIHSGHVLDTIKETDSASRTPLIVLSVVQLVMLYLPMIVSLVWVSRKCYRKVKGGKQHRHGYEMIEDTDRQ